MFSLTLPLLSVAASERSSKQVKGAQGEQNLKLRAKNQRIRQEQSKKRKAPEEKRFVRTVVGAVCYSSLFVCLLFVPGEVFQGQGKN